MKASTGSESSISPARGRYSAARRPSALAPQLASTRPIAPPTTASTRLSVRSWRTSRIWLPPRAVRTAISRSRAVARASSRLATLAQPIRSTKPTAPSRIRSAGRTSPTTCSASGSTTGCQPAPVGIVLGVLLGQPRTQHLDLRAGVLDRLPRLEAADEVEHPGTPGIEEVGVGVVERDRGPHLHGRGAALQHVPEAARHDADDRHRIIVEPDRLPDDPGIPAEPLTPEVIRDDRDVADSPDVVFPSEVPAQRGLHAEQAEVVVGDDRRLDALRLTRGR